MNLPFNRVLLTCPLIVFLKVNMPLNRLSKVNMPADSFESPLTLAACGGHTELALLLLERGANIEEVIPIDEER